VVGRCVPASNKTLDQRRRSSDGEAKSDEQIACHIDAFFTGDTQQDKTRQRDDRSQVDEARADVGTTVVRQQQCLDGTEDPSDSQDTCEVRDDKRKHVSRGHPEEEAEKARVDERQDFRQTVVGDVLTCG